MTNFPTNPFITSSTGPHLHHHNLKILAPTKHSFIASSRQGHGDVGSNEASDASDEDREANDEDGEGWSQKETREGNRSKEKEKKKKKGEQPETRERKN